MDTAILDEQRRGDFAHNAGLTQIHLLTALKCRVPEIHELFGRPVNIRDPEKIGERKAALCPFTDSLCDGGGNRHQTKINLKKDAELAKFFNPDLDSVIPGICSIDYGSGTEAWVVCPRRLLGFKHDGAGLPEVNIALQEHERQALIAAELPTGIEVGIWSEIYLQYGDEEAEINYHFDFVAAPLLRDVTFQELFNIYGIENEEQSDLVAAARKGGWFKGKYKPETTIEAAPDLSQPIILEVMTASTSGSNTEAGTNISASFRDAILTHSHQSPGINKRQVWGRMATQLFAKSALAEAWGGRTVWIVQDELLKNIELTTKLAPAQVQEAHSGNITFISMTYNKKGTDVGAISMQNVFKGMAGIDFSGSDTYADILIPKTMPEKRELLKSMLRRSLAGIVKL